MLGAGVAPDSREDTLLASSLHLRRDVIDQLPRRSGGLTIAVVDACRTSLRAALNATDGFNQVEAPLGCLIVFSTGAGKPAIAPAVETLNTFYTASLVKLLASAADETSFSDLFRLVKFDVQQTMENYPVQAIRQFTQIPFIAENTQVRFQLSQRPEKQSTLPQFGAAEEAAAWRELEDNLWPAEIVKLAEAYLQHYPSSKLAGGAQGRARRRGRRGQGAAQQRGAAFPQRLPAEDERASLARRMAQGRARRQGRSSPDRTRLPARRRRHRRRQPIATKAGCSTPPRSVTASRRTSSRSTTAARSSRCRPHSTKRAPATSAIRRHPRSTTSANSSAGSAAPRRAGRPPSLSVPASAWRSRPGRRAPSAPATARCRYSGCRSGRAGRARCAPAPGGRAGTANSRRRRPAGERCDGVGFRAALARRVAGGDHALDRKAELAQVAQPRGLVFELERRDANQFVSRRRAGGGRLHGALDGRHGGPERSSKWRRKWARRRRRDARRASGPSASRPAGRARPGRAEGTSPGAGVAEMEVEQDAVGVEGDQGSGHAGTVAKRRGAMSQRRRRKVAHGLERPRRPPYNASASTRRDEC